MSGHAKKYSINGIILLKQYIQYTIQYILVEKKIRRKHGKKIYYHYLKNMHI